MYNNEYTFLNRKEFGKLTERNALDHNAGCISGKGVFLQGKEGYMKENVTSRIRRWFSYLMIIVLMTLMIPAMPSEASAKSTALTMYRKLLNKSRISVLPQRVEVEGPNYTLVRYWSSNASNVKFCLAYIDGDDVPELILSDRNYGFGIWTYKNGSYRCLFWGDLYCSPVGYFYKKGIFRDNEYSEGSPFTRDYYKLQVGVKRQRIQYESCNNGPERLEIWGRYIRSGSRFKKVGNADYYKNLRKYTGKTSMSMIYLHNNTSANKKKYIK